jgi:Ca2+-binding EF-hand superfamily protein
MPSPRSADVAVVENPLNSMDDDDDSVDLDVVAQVKVNKYRREGSLDPTESATSEVTDEDMEKVESVFTTMDTDSDGQISITELAEKLRQGGDFNDEKIMSVMRALDTDGSGYISMKEFKAREISRVSELKILYHEMVRPALAHCTKHRCVGTSGALSVAMLCVSLLPGHCRR